MLRPAARGSRIPKRLRVEVFMPTNIDRPNEFPEGGEGGGGGVFRPRPGINEFPLFETQISSVVLQEVLRLRERVHGLENRLLLGGVGSRGGSIEAFAARYNPAEFPEGDGGDGGGGIIHRGPGIQELPAGPYWENFAQEVSLLRQQMVGLSSAVQALTQQMAKNG
jgi:hypothetical protein